MYRCCYYGKTCFHTEDATNYTSSPDPEGPTADDLAYDAMLTHLTEAHGAIGTEANYLVHQGRRSAVA